MKYWTIVLHFYQPPTQDLQITSAIHKSCYLPLVKMLQEKEGVGLSVNICGSLLMQLEELGATEFIKSIREMVEQGKIELLNSPVYHPVIPLTPAEVVRRQLELNRELIRRVVGVEPSRGVFPPELAVDPETVNVVKEYGDFMVVDERAVGKMTLAQIGEENLLVNNREICEIVRTYPTWLDAQKVKNRLSENELTVTVHDAELFGHHYEERLGYLSDLLSSTDVRFVKGSELVRQFEKEKKLVKEIKSSSWQQMDGFNLWNGNGLQRKYFKLAKLANQVWNETEIQAGEDLRKSTAEDLDKGWSSCHLYWLSNTPWWHPEIVEKGADRLIRCIRAMPASSEVKIEAEKLFHSFLKEMWIYHWSGKVGEGYRKHEEERSKVLSEVQYLVG